MGSLTHQLTHSLTYSLTYSLTHSLTHSLTYSITHLLTYLLTYSLIQVSRDRNTEEFVNYYQKMPWLAVTVENIPSAVERLGAMYKMNGIPHFVIVDADDGAVITLDGRTAVMKVRTHSLAHSLILTYLFCRINMGWSFLGDRALC